MDQTILDDVADMTRGEFSIAVTWTVAGGTPVTVRGIRDHAYMEGAADQFSGASTREAELTVATADLPPGAAAGDAVEVDGTAHVVRHLEPDGTGATRVALEVA